MRYLAVLLAAGLAAQQDPPRKLTDDEKIEILRGLTAESATVKAYLPRSKSALRFNSDGTWNKTDWQEAGREYGPVARTGESVQITKVDLDDDKITLQINGGLNVKGKWYERIEAGGGMGGSGRTVPLNKNPTRSAGTTIAVVWPGKMPVVSAADVKKILIPVLEFDKRSATEQYFDTLPPDVQEAIKAKKAIVGMDKEQVILAMGRARDRIRETKDGIEEEDWIYGLPPGKITFVTFANGKVIRVKDTYAGLGGQTGPPLKPPQ
jgi:hypothetical protein